MFPKRFQDLKTGFELLNSMHIKKHLKKVGLEKEDYYFWKQVGKALLCSYAILGAVWLSRQASSMGWWMPKEEEELAHLNEQQEFPYPGGVEAIKDFIAKGGMFGTSAGPKGIVESGKCECNYQKELDSKKFEQEAQQVWLSMRNEVIAELKEKGFNVK